MLNKIILFLRKETHRGILSYRTNRASLFTLISVFFVLFFFKPFGLADFKPIVHRFLIVGYSVCAFIGYCTIITIFSPYNRNKWTKFLEICTYFACFLFVTILIYVYTLFCFKIIFPKVLKIETLGIRTNHLFYKIFFYTNIIGFIIYRLFLMYDILHSYKNLSKISRFNTKKFYQKKNGNHLKFFGKNKNEHITLETDTFICIKSEGHYIKVYYMCPKSNQVKNMVLRNTMKEIENQTINYSFIYRCHKSFIINLDFLNSVIGNSNRTHIYLEHFSDAIPISKNKISFIKDRSLKKVI